MTVKFLLVAQHDQAQTQLITALQNQELEVVRSFDLRSMVKPGSTYLCPGHGAVDCNCQYSVLLVYGRRGPEPAGWAALEPSDPATLTLHSREAMTQIELIQNPNTQADPALLAVIVAAVAEVSSAQPAQPAI